MAKASELNIVEDFEKSVEQIKMDLEFRNTRIEIIEKEEAYQKYKDDGYDINAIFSLDKGQEELSEDTKELLKYANSAKSLEQLYKEKEELEKKLADNIHVMKVSIKKHVTNSEKELKKLEKAKTDFENYVKEEKSKKEVQIAKLIEEIANEENEAIRDARQREKDNLEAEIKALNNDLEKYSSKVETLKGEIEQVKEKYKEYLELEDIKKEEKEELSEETILDKETIQEEVEPEPKEEPEVVNEEHEEVVEVEEDKPKTTVAKEETVVENDGEKTEEEKPEEKLEESDEKAFARIRKKLLNRKTRHNLTYKEFDKMTEILSNPENFEKLNINTSRFLGRIPSKTDKIYKQLGRIMAYQIEQDVKDKKILAKFNKKELASIRNIDKFGVNIEEISKSEEIINLAIANADESAKPKLMELQKRMLSYRKSIEVLANVRIERGEAYINQTNALAEATKPEVVEEKQNELSKLQEQVMKEPAPLSEEIVTDDKVKDKDISEMEEI